MAAQDAADIVLPDVAKNFAEAKVAETQPSSQFFFNDRDPKTESVNGATTDSTMHDTVLRPTDGAYFKTADFSRACYTGGARARKEIAGISPSEAGES